MECSNSKANVGVLVFVDPTVSTFSAAALNASCNVLVEVVRATSKVCWALKIQAATVSFMSAPKERANSPWPRCDPRLR